MNTIFMKNLSPITTTILLIFFLSGCASTVDHYPLTKEEFNQVDFTEIIPERWWGDIAPPNLEEGLMKQAAILRERFPGAINATKDTAPSSNALVLSGGGANGSYGVGILDGWTRSGMRPDFEYVTGISTGAMIAPFAFLGSDYDEQLIQAYSSITADKIFNKNTWVGTYYGSALNDTTPLRTLVETYVTEELVSAIAVEARKGRSLSIITTQFDALRPIVWDIGAIAINRGAAGVPLIQKIILASAAIPGVFPPVSIEWELNGVKFTELHVDGAVSSQIFAYPAQISIEQVEKITGLVFKRRLYVIQNSNNSPVYAPAPVRTIPIISRALSGLLMNQVNKDVERIYFLSERDGIEFYMTSIPNSFEATGSAGFENSYMNDLIALGREIGATGDFWLRIPSTMSGQEN